MHLFPLSYSEYSETVSIAPIVPTFDCVEVFKSLIFDLCSLTISLKIVGFVNFKNQVFGSWKSIVQVLGSPKVKTFVFNVRLSGNQVVLIGPAKCFFLVLQTSESGRV